MTAPTTPSVEDGSNRPSLDELSRLLEVGIGLKTESIPLVIKS